MYPGIILDNNQLDSLFLMYLFISLLYMFGATRCSSSGDDEPGMPVRKFLADRHTRQSPTQSDIPDDVLIQFDSPDDEHWVARNM